MRKVLVIGATWPEPASTAAGNRMMQLIALLQRNSYQVCFASTASQTEFSVDFSEQNITTYNIQLNHTSFDEFIANLHPDIVLFDRFITEEQFGWRVAKHCPTAIRLLDTEDLHGLRQGRYLALKEGKPFTTNYLVNDVAKREIASIVRSDLTLIISTAEMELLQAFFKIPSTQLLYLPFLVNNNVAALNVPGFAERNEFLSIGNFLHEPNWDSVLYLKQSIWPLIRRQQANAVVRVYGAYPSEKVNKLHNPKEGFYCMGRAQEVSEVMFHARVCLAPLRFGAGLKGKLLDAMLYGTPSVTTSIGAEGMVGKNQNWNGTVVDEPAAFAEAAVELYHSEEKWNASQQNGFLLLQQNFNVQLFETSVMARLEVLQTNLEQHRNEHFLSRVLLHDTLGSTKYMALFIEEKNKHNL